MGVKNGVALSGGKTSWMEMREYYNMDFVYNAHTNGWNARYTVHTCQVKGILTTMRLFLNKQYGYFKVIFVGSWGKMTEFRELRFGFDGLGEGLQKTCTNKYCYVSLKVGYAPVESTN